MRKLRAQRKTMGTGLSPSCLVRAFSAECPPVPWELAGLQAGGLGNFEQLLSPGMALGTWHCPSPNDGPFLMHRPLSQRIPHRMEPQSSTPSGTGHLLAFPTLAHLLRHTCVQVHLSNKCAVLKSLLQFGGGDEKPDLSPSWVLNWGSLTKY